jgi:hypothetical protein
MTRRGGLAGLPLSADLDTERFERVTAARIERALDELVARQPEVAAAPRPDAFEYEIVLPERGESARVAESDLPRALRPLVRALSVRGTPVPRQQRPPA